MTSPAGADPRRPADGPASSLDALIRRFDRLRAGASTAAGRKAVLAVAAVALVAGALVAWRSRPDVPTDPRPWLLALAVATAVPLHVALNGAELLVMARIGRTRMPLGEAARVTVLSSAANLLPIPGAVLIRTQALQRLGSTGRRALSVTMVVGLGWVATAFVVAGLLLLATEPTGAAAAFLGVGALGLAATWALLGRYPADRNRAFAALVAVEAAATLAAGLRVYLTVLGLGYDAGFAAGVALSLSAPLSSLVGIFPGGVGLREFIAAALAPLVGISAAVALLATIVDRLLGAVVQVVLSLVLLVAPGARRRLVADVARAEAVAADEVVP
jgi:hypothetical protein